MTGAITLAATADTGTGEAVVFWLLAPVATLAAAGMLLVRKAVHSALLLAVTMLCLAVFYIAEDASFLGVVQVVVYTGAVMMLFLFVLMLVGVDSADSLVETLRGERLQVGRPSRVHRRRLAGQVGLGQHRGQQRMPEPDTVAAAEHHDSRVDGLAN